MKTISILFVLITSLTFLFCRNENKIVDSEIVKLEATPEFKEDIVEIAETEFNDPNVAVVFEAYIKLKTALVNTDNVNAVIAANALLETLDKIEGSDEIKKVVLGIAESNEIAVQREAFVIATAFVEKMLDGALSSGTVYKQYCPMALNNTGAYWLSTSKDIQNPYFGDKMLKCGRVASEIK